MSTGKTRISPKTTTWVLVLAALASLVAALDAMVVSTALTTIRVDLGASIGQLEWTVNAYNLTAGVLLLPAAALGDRLGRRRMFTVGLAVFVAASAGCAMAPDAGWLIAVRAVQGAGAALVVPNALALVSAAFPTERRGAALGILQGITGMAVVAGPVLGGAVAEGIDWEWIFWLNVPIGLAAIPLALARMPESVGSDTKLDLGVGLVTGGALGILWGLVRGNAAGWGSPEVATALALGFAMLAAFVAWERRAREPMLPMRFFRSRAFSFGNRGHVLPVRVAVRRSVLPAPVPADEPRPRTARDRAAAGAMDRDTVRRRTDRQRSGRPDRRATATRRRTRLQGGPVWPGSL